ncbi:GNAT family N-acetyltransferase [Cryobacterium sp. M91]|uniref:GNAT family N-acetyltransferase n=1 Tax=Cryobacterium sp. M91 TaxID=2048294 RepID=UPI000CE51DE3
MGARRPALYLFAGPSLTWPPTVEQFEEIAKRPGLSASVVDDDESQAAWGHFDLTVQGGSARLGRVIVDPRCRGQGLGHTLTQAVIEKARGLGVSKIRLAVVTDNEPAVKAYRRAGFKEVVDPERPLFTTMAYQISDRS